MKVYARFIKRPLGFSIALVAIVVMAVPMLVIAVIVKATSSGPVLRSHMRVGRNGKEFLFYKFRSMYINAPIIPSAEIDPSFITPIGKIIRKTSLDELPQLFNVLKGNMAIIGYRPLIGDEVWINEARQKSGVLATRPGITGLAQVNGRDAVTWRDKVGFDKKYADEITFLSDVKIILKSFTVILVHDATTRDEQIETQPHTQHQYEEARNEG